ncbi:hypothetical protein CEXT_129751 [Caerostris extrusa]|uniref:Uncharacterized protein n=1 Tax=Caerostris extrusa TaxID=172846 RepID=A0AAV4MFE3_CAEEX|nr:hypothetical protein CEXT_129751 [Caerostris extrusa]
MIFIITDNCPTPINPSNLDFACTKTLMRARKTICHQLLFRIVLPQFGLFTARQVGDYQYPTGSSTPFAAASGHRLCGSEVTGQRSITITNCLTASGVDWKFCLDVFCIVLYRKAFVVGEQNRHVTYSCLLMCKG